eukprot:TRINITY_DN1479_c0_g1_i4.p1 TRINITY_DN1479_c0_g1~~TRINITY_DN1479_c0_g1_i4.p1  ORF type:complete len:1203 (+),score=201.03 TRINITY_DN1479_c0_g1_i4:1722-5330(+)
MWAWLAAVGGAAALPLWDSDLLCPFRATSPALCEGSGFEECFWNDPVEDCLYGESDNTYNAVMWRRCSDDQCIAEMWRRVVPVDICTPYPVRHNNSQWHIYIQGSCQNSGVKMRLFETWKECVSAVPDFGGNGYNATLGIQVMPEGTSPPEDMTLVAVDHTHYGLAGQLFNGATLKTRYDLISCYIPVPFDAVADDNCGYRSRLGCAIKPSCVLDFPDTKTYGCAVGPATGPKSGRTVLTRVDTPNRTTDEAGTVVIKISAWLSRPPLGADTVFTVEANDTNEAFVEPSTLTFNEFNYAVEQTVIIWGADDDVIDGMTAYEVTFSVNATDDTEYSSMHPVSLQFWNADDDVAEVLFSVTANETSEVGAPAPALVVVGLASAPAGACVLAVNTNDTTEGYATPERLTFNGTSWSDLQMVTVVGVDDADADGDTAFLLTLSIYDCDDAQYSALAPSAIVFVNLDNDVALPVTPSPQTPAPQTASPVTASPLTPAPQTASPESQAGVLTEVFGGHITSESGQRAVIQVRLAAAPAGMAPTVLTFWTSHDGEGEAIPSTVTYTSASWSQSQNVTVQGVDDDIPDGDVEYEISIHVTDSGDQSYLDLEPTYLTFTNLDNDTLVSTTSQAAASTTSQTTVSSSQSSGAESPSATTTSAPPSPAPPTISPPTSAPPTSSPPSPAPPTISPALTTISPPTSTPSTSSLPSPTPLTISPPLPSPAPTQAAVGAAAAEETAVVPVGLWAAMAVVALVLGCGAVWWCWRRRGLREFEEPPALSDESELMLREDTASTLKDLKGRIDSATPYRTAEADPLPLTDSRVTLRETTQSLRMQQSYLGVPPLFSAYSSATAPPRRRDVLRDASRTSSDATTAEGGDLIYTPSYVDVLRPLGHGAYGAVYLAAHKVTMEQVAVKRMTMSAGAETELKMLRKLRHPRIVALKGFHVEGALGGVAEAYLYLEYVSGGSLYDLVQNSGGRLFEASVRRLMKDAVLGLHYLHAHGVVHRDIKPHNLLVDGNGRVKVADFGCCKDVDTGTASRVQGTPHYMAPEACHGRASAASDIWSVGACICELASGLPPWHEAGRSGMALMFYITSQGEKGVHPQIPETASPGAKEAIERCFARDAADRWTCDSLLQSPLFMDVGTPLPGQETLEGYNSTRDKPDNAASPFASPAASPRNAQGAPQGSPKSALWAASMSIPAETLATLEDL